MGSQITTIMVSKRVSLISILIKSLNGHMGHDTKMVMPVQHTRYAYCDSLPNEKKFLVKPPANSTNYITDPKYDFPHKDISYSPTCKSDLYQKESASKFVKYLPTITEMMYHMEENENMFNYKSDIPNNGPHKAMWAAFGEYTYLPPTRYLHNLEHGGILFLYHPCTNKNQVNRFKTIAKNCLWKHLISTWDKGLSKEYPFAVVAWGHTMLVGNIELENVSKETVNFVIEHAWKGEKGNCWGNVGYINQLVDDANIVSDMTDTRKCEKI